MRKQINRVVISGGGTGGHIFPAIAIANEIKKRNPQVSILFVGAQGKMEMERVPQAGYEITGLPIVGFQRKLSFSNFLLPFKLLKSLLKARNVLKKNDPELVVGVGGYASGPTLKMAQLLGIPTVIQEQNSFPGKTNILLSKKAKLICTAYSGLEQFFSLSKIRLTGNPVREELSPSSLTRVEALKVFDLEASRKTILVIGGSLGAKTLNEALSDSIEAISKSNIQVIWQCGKGYYQALLNANLDLPKHIKLLPFISRMDAAYTAADVVISRAGALSVSELCLIGKATILVPSPNVAEDHQTKNAMALVANNAALMVKDHDAVKSLVQTIFDLLNDKEQVNKLSENIKKLAKPNATKEIIDACETIINNDEE